MKLIKSLAITALAISLYACGCEDVNLGKIEFTNELTTFLPATPAPGKSYYVTVGTASQKMSYVNAAGTTSVQLPVRRTNYNGKFDPNHCKEYFTADQKVYTSQIEGQHPMSFKITYKKDASTEGFNDIYDKNSVRDVIEYTVGYDNKLPTPIQVGTVSMNNYLTLRSFVFRDATTAPTDYITYKQEFLPTVMLNGVQHNNVYHLYFSQTGQYRAEEQYIREQYPALDFIEGIYVKEGEGIVYAYSLKGKQVAISVN